MASEMCKDDTFIQQIIIKGSYRKGQRDVKANLV